MSSRPVGRHRSLPGHTGWADRRQEASLVQGVTVTPPMMVREQKLSDGVTTQ